MACLGAQHFEWCRGGEVGGILEYPSRSPPSIAVRSGKPDMWAWAELGHATSWEPCCAIWGFSQLCSGSAGGVHSELLNCLGDYANKLVINMARGLKMAGQPVLWLRSRCWHGHYHALLLVQRRRDEVVSPGWRHWCKNVLLLLCGSVEAAEGSYPSRESLKLITSQWGQLGTSVHVHVTQAHDAHIVIVWELYGSRTGDANFEAHLLWILLEHSRGFLK